MILQVLRNNFFVINYEDWNPFQPQFRAVVGATKHEFNLLVTAVKWRGDKIIGMVVGMFGALSVRTAAVLKGPVSLELSQLGL